MKNLILQPTKNTPYVNFHSNGDFLIEGRSYPQDSITFFKPLFKFIEEFKGSNVRFEAKMEYFNTSTCKQILSLFRKIIDQNIQGEVKIVWYYEYGDQDLIEIGKQMQNILNIKFEFVVMSESKNKVFL